MKFPDTKRVIYEKNPLVEVICQLRFPTILRISQQQPVDFQDKIRFDYPIFEFSQGNQIPQEMLHIMQKLGKKLINNQAYVFKSEDLNWQIVLNQESVTLSTKDYKRYEIFKEL